MQEDDDGLKVEQNTGQQPFMRGESNQNLQQTKESESFGVETNQQGVSQAEQDKILEFLRSEAAGPSYSSASTQSGLRSAEFIFLPLIAVSLIILFIIYYRFFARRLARGKQ